MAKRTHFLSLVLTLCFTPVFLSAVPLPADCEVDPAVSDPGNHPVSPADCLKGPTVASFRCKDGSCSEIAEYTFDAKGEINLSYAGQTFKISGSAGQKTWTSGKFSSNRVPMVQCSSVPAAKCPPQPVCTSHGFGCGSWSVYTGKDCAFPAGTGIVWGWATGCG